MTLKVRLSGQGQVLHFEVKRPGPGRPDRRWTSSPGAEPGMDYPTIGVLPAKQPGRPVFSAPRAAWNQLPALPSEFTDPDLKSVETLVAAGPAGEQPPPLHERRGLRRAAGPASGPAAGPRLRAQGKIRTRPASKRYEFTLPPAHFVDFGFRLTGSRSASIQQDSPAEKAGFRIGDRIVKVERQGRFRPDAAAQHLLRARRQAHDLRGRAASRPRDRYAVTLTVTPDDTPLPGCDARSVPRSRSRSPGSGSAILSVPTSRRSARIHRRPGPVSSRAT